MYDFNFSKQKKNTLSHVPPHENKSTFTTIYSPSLLKQSTQLTRKKIFFMNRITNHFFNPPLQRKKKTNKTNPIQK